MPFDLSDYGRIRQHLMSRGYKMLISERKPNGDRRELWQ